MEEKAKKINQIIHQILEETTSELAKRSSTEGKLSISKMDENQLVHYNLSLLTAEGWISEQFSNYASEHTDLEKEMALIFAGEALQHLRSELSARWEEFGVSAESLSSLYSKETGELISDSISKDRYESVARQVLSGSFGEGALSEDHAMLRDTFRDFANNVVAPRAEHVHRNDEFIPEEILTGLQEMGAFGLSIPAEFEGYHDDYGNVGMMVVTEELSRASLSIAGSLITRPEILGKALMKGGTDDQKKFWLPKLSTGERMCAVAVTEPDFGSDVAGMKVTAEKVDGGWLLNGVKTWCTFAGFADTLLVLARTEKDPSLKHRGLSILLAEKPRDTGHKFKHTQNGGGVIEGSSIATIGYRGMHSFEVNFDSYFVPDANLIGGDEGRGKGFYLQMEGFTGGRAQTAARANGVMQAALESAVRYANERHVFGTPVGEYQMTRWKIARMATILQATRQYSYYVGRLMDQGKGSMEATLVKFYASRMAEWVTREAMQIHGGMGYAEEYPVSRYFVDARVFSIFEGAEEVMALRVCARELLQNSLKG